MIKTRYGDIEITGSAIEVLADYAFITREVISAFKQKMNEGTARALVKNAYNKGMEESIKSKDRLPSLEDRAADELISASLDGDKKIDKLLDDAAALIAKSFAEDIKKE